MRHQCCLIHRHRGQARSHKKQCNTSGSRSGDGNQVKHSPPVGASLLAKAVCQSHRCWMCHRLREQARSHKKPGAILQAQALPPSRSGNGSQVKHRTLWERACSRKRYISHIDAGWAAAFASKPAPTKTSAIPRVPALPPSRSGDVSQVKHRTLWEQACSRKRYISHIDAGWAAAFASRLAPTKKQCDTSAGLKYGGNSG